MQVVTKIVIRGAYIGCKFAIGKTVKGISSPQVAKTFQYIFMYNE